MPAPQITLWPRFLLVWVGLLACAACAQPLEVASQSLRLATDASTGDFFSLTDRATGAEYLIEDGTPAFQFRVSQPDGSSEWVDSRSAAEVQHEALTDEGDTGYSIRYLSVAPGMDAALEVRTSPESPELRLRLGVTNQSGRILETLVFPMLRARRPLGADAEDDRVFVPGGDGFEAGPEAMERVRWLRRAYPGHASMQFWAYYDGACGLSLRCEDTQALPKVVGVAVDDASVDLAAWFQRPFLPDQDFTSPWVVVRPCSGSWLNAADDYRQWARDQWWAQPKTHPSVFVQHGLRQEGVWLPADVEMALFGLSSLRLRMDEIERVIEGRRRSREETGS